jgi:hypothetical protein
VTAQALLKSEASRSFSLQIDCIVCIEAHAIAALFSCFRGAPRA